jgi:hypothetical protein
MVNDNKAMFLFDNMAFISSRYEILVGYSQKNLRLILHLKFCIQILEQLYYWLFKTYVRQVLFIISSHTLLQ